MSAKRGSAVGCASRELMKLDAGSLFGPVVAAAVILNPRRRIVGLDDSKKLTAERRTELAPRIREHALAWAVAEIDASRIDAWNIYQASRQAMMAAVSQLSPLPDYLLLDAMEIDLPIEQKALIHGDARSVSIAAASILAKTERDRRMEEFDQQYPQYGLAQHKGYGTPEHLEALRRHGPTPLHRFSYAPVRQSACWASGATQDPLPLSSASGILPARNSGYPATSARRKRKPSSHPALETEPVGAGLTL